MRDPSRKRRWVTTASIIYNQAQSIGLLRSLDLRWPLSIRRLSAALSLELFSVPDVGCLLDEGVPPFWQYAFSVLSTCAALLALPAQQSLLDGANARAAQTITMHGHLFALATTQQYVVTEKERRSKGNTSQPCATSARGQQVGGPSIAAQRPLQSRVSCVIAAEARTVERRQ